jgi:hypothetical protein
LKKPEKPVECMIHIRMSADVHKRLRIRSFSQGEKECAAEQDTTIQDWVARLVESELDRQKPLRPQH